MKVLCFLVLFTLVACDKDARIYAEEQSDDCPEVSKDGSNCPIICSKNDHCDALGFKGYICCYDGCGSACVKPEKKTRNENNDLFGVKRNSDASHHDLQDKQMD